MKIKLVFILFSLVLLAISSADAVPPPCSRQELLQSSDYAIEGEVLAVECGDPYQSQQCKPSTATEAGDFEPELVADCKATVKVTKALAGDYQPGAELEIPFVKLVQECRNGEHSIPGLPIKNFRTGAKIRYYHSSECTYSNFEELEGPHPEPVEPEDKQFSPNVVVWFKVEVTRNMAKELIKSLNVTNYQLSGPGWSEESWRDNISGVAVIEVPKESARDYIKKFNQSDIVKTADWNKIVPPLTIWDTAWGKVVVVVLVILIIGIGYWIGKRFYQKKEQTFFGKKV